MVKTASALLKSPCNALQETPSTILNKKPASDEILESIPLKKRKISTDDAKTSKQSSINPPSFMTETTLPGEDNVMPIVPKLIVARGPSLR
jgi:hypothetical protein